MTNIEKYFYNKISPDELEGIRAEENGKSDDQLYKELQSLWDKEMGNDSDIEYDDAGEPVSKPRRAMKVALWITSVAASLLLITTLFVGQRFMSFRNAVLAQQMEVATRPGEQAMVSLSDGTQIRLNGRSKLKYPSVFSGDERKVELSGEGYFNVAHNAGMPFIVSAGDVVVKVLGTEFDFRCNKEEGKSTVMLYKGSVQLTASKTGENATLHPNEKAEVDLESGRVSVSPIAAGQQSYQAWTRHQLVFDDIPLHEVLKSVAYNYGLRLKIQSSLSDARFTGTLPDNRIEEVVETLEIIYKIRISVSGNSMTVSKK